MTDDDEAVRLAAEGRRLFESNVHLRQENHDLQAVADAARVIRERFPRLTGPAFRQLCEALDQLDGRPEATDGG